MKKLIFVCATILTAVFATAQSNNPYNQLGLDILTATNAIMKDFSEGKIKDLNQATIDRYYQTLLPGQQAVKLEDVTRITNALKGLDSKSAIENSGLSKEAKAFLYKSFDSSTTAVVDQVNKSALSTDEKKVLLSYLAINYHIAKSLEAKQPKSTGKGPDGNYDFTYDENPVLANFGPETTLWGVLGFIVGYTLCGPWCGVGGAIVGMIMANTGSGPTRVTVNPGNSYHPSTGHYNGPTP